MIIRKPEKNDAVYIAYESMERTGLVSHGFSTRCGGVSEGHLSSMNLSYSRGDKKENVDENFRRIADAIGFSFDSMVFTDQTHTANVRVATAADAGAGYLKERGFSDVDGLVTNVRGLTLAGFYADCVPLMFLDPVAVAVGMSHSGWRGTAGRIGRNTVELMMREYGSRPEDILVVIGPSICQQCYEVSEDVAEVFFAEFDEKYHSQILENGKEKGKFQLDLHAANRIILTEAGILPEHIEMPGICTCHNPEFLFSHRASNGKRGNLAGFISLR